MRISYYPGCSLHGTGSEYESSIKAVAESLGIELIELPDWNCCGASSAHATDAALARNLAVRNLVIAQEQKMDLLVPCAACYNRLKAGSGEGAGDYSPLKYDFQILNPLELLSSEEVGRRITSLIKRPLVGLKVAPYYGCLLVRPPRLTGAKNFEDPKEMESLLKIMGAEIVSWSYKTDCCGGSLVLTQRRVGQRLVKKILVQALAAGAEAIVVACPLCHSNLDSRQAEVTQETGENYEIPIFYISELLGLALGHKDNKKWWKKHFVPPGKILAAKALL